MDTGSVGSVVRRTGRAAILTMTALAFGVTLGACGGSAKTPPARALMSEARTTIDRARTVSFSISSTGVPGTTTAISSGNGFLKRPSDVSATFEIQVEGVDTSIAVKADSSRLLARLPFQSGFSRVNPERYGIGNPAELASRSKGLAAILTHAKLDKSVGPERVSGELLDEVKGTIPGADIPVLPNKAPARPVGIVALINPSSHELRQLRLKGPFLSATSNTTYALVLSQYNAPEHFAMRAH